MSEQSSTLAIKPVIHYPERMEVGKTYVMSVDLEMVDGYEWTYDDEEYPIYCHISSHGGVKKYTVDEPVIVLHKHGGSYGAVQLLLEATSLEESRGAITLDLVNKLGHPIDVVELEITIFEASKSTKNEGFSNEREFVTTKTVQKKDKETIASQEPPSFLTLLPKYCQQFKERARFDFKRNVGYIAGLTREILDGQNVHISADTVARLLDGKRGRAQNVIAICNYFGVSWVEACITSDRFPTLMELVQRVRSKAKFRFTHSDNSAIYQQQKQWLIENFIEPDLVEVEFLPSEYPVSSPEILLNDENSTENDFDRLGIRLIRGKKTNSKNVLAEHHNVFVYGEPGSGKSIYLQWIALKCYEGEFLEDHVPIFMEIRQFATVNSTETLLIYIEKIFERWGFSSSEARRVLEAGQAVFIFDGIDEIPLSERDRIESMIVRLLYDYDGCHFVFSSRLATYTPFSENFQKVIIAPFHPKRQIPEFVRRWFAQPGKEPAMATQMLEKLQSKSYQGIRELARRPVLLKLLCIVFELYGDFPPRRGEVFERAIEEMTRPKADLETDIADFPRLQNNLVQGVLCRIASYFFIDLKFQILFATRDVERIIQDYFQEVLGINRDSIPSQAILNYIEQNNGLLVRWSQDFCAFSHLTYQEFFTATHLIKTSTYTRVYEHLGDQRWHFVIGLIAELIRKEDSFSFFDGFKHTIDNYIRKDSRLRELMETLNHAATFSAYSFSTEQNHLQTYIRAWYLVYSLQDTGKITNLGEFDTSFELPDFNFATSMVTNPILEGHEYLYKAYHCLCQKEPAGKKLRDFIVKLQQFLRDNPQKSEVLVGWLQQLKKEQVQFMDSHQWWETKRLAWLKRVALFMKNLGLPCVYDLNREQVIELRTYYDMTKLLSTCMNRSHLDKAQQGRLADSLLLLTTTPLEEQGRGDRYA